MSTPDRDDPAPSEPAPGEASASEMIAAALGSAARRVGVDPSQEASTGHVVWRAMGGWRGVLESVLPSLVFVVVYTVSIDAASGEGNLPLSLGLSVGIAAVFTVLRFVQRQLATAALGGLIAAVAAAALALLTDSGANNFLFGFFVNGAYTAAFLVSVLVGWPIIGLAVGFLKGEGTSWRDQPRKKRAFAWLSLAWAALFGLRLAVQLPFYLADDVTALGTLKLVMGLPLFAPLVAVTWLATRALYRDRVR